MTNKFYFRGLVLGDDSEYSEYVYGGICYDDDAKCYLITKLQLDGTTLLYEPSQDSIQQFINNEWVNI